MEFKPILSNKDLGITPTLSPEGNLNPDYASHILFNAQRYGQGNAGLIRFIYAYTHNIRPEWKVSDETAEEVYKNVLGKSKRFFKRAGAYETHPTEKPTFHPSVAGADIEKDLHGRVSDMQRALNGTGYHRLEHQVDLVRAIARGTIEQDFRWIVEQDGRPRTEDGDPNTLGDRYLSYLCHYAYNGATTGVAEFDEMYRDVRGLLKFGDNAFSWSWQTDAQWAMVVDKYNEHHPETTVKP